METQNATSRSKGAVGPRALVPRMFRKWFPAKHTITLDFGAGKGACHAQALQAEGYLYVHAYEYGTNWHPERHISTIFPGKYDVAYASNVLNVQTDWSEVVGVVLALHQAIHRNGAVIVNLPQSPRKSAWSHSRASKGIEGRCERDDDLIALKALLGGFFGRVQKIEGTAGAPVYLCRDKIQPKE